MHDSIEYASGFFKTSNKVVDNNASSIPPTAFKLYIVLIRKIEGWHKSSDRISISQLMQITGIKGRSTIISAITQLEVAGLIHVEKSSAGNIYSLTKQIYSELNNQSPESEGLKSEPECDKNLDYPQSDICTTASPINGHTIDIILNTPKYTKKINAPLVPFSLDQIELPQGVSRDAWMQYCLMRSDECSPVDSLRKAAGLISQLRELIAQGQDPNACLKHAQDKCWKSIHPIYKSRGTSDYSSHNKYVHSAENTSETQNPFLAISKLVGGKPL